MGLNNSKDLPKFHMPQNLIDQLYELSGNADKYKGVILGYISEDGVPLIYAKYDSQIIEFGMRKALEKYLDSSDAFETLSNEENGLDEEE